MTVKGYTNAIPEDNTPLIRLFLDNEFEPCEGRTDEDIIDAADKKWRTILKQLKLKGMKEDWIQVITRRCRNKPYNET